MIGDLDQRLGELAATLVVPPAPDLSQSVLARLPQRGAPRARVTRRTLAFALAAVLLLAGTAMAVPPTRDAILRVLGLRGVSIERLRQPPSLPARAGAKLGLGKRIPLSRARHDAGFTALLPPSATAAYLANDIPGGRISLLVGADLVIEVRGVVDPFFIKLIGPGTRAQRVRVNGGPGIYLYGAPHEVIFGQAEGAPQADRVRIAGNVLLWQQGPLTLRVEGTHTLKQALALARSLR
jgi:hypothetical protein